MDQRTIKAMQIGGNWPHPVDGVRLVETHISWVLLTGDYAYKIKKPVDFGFLDFSTLEKRKQFCEEEVRLNRRLAADLYLDVVTISGTPDAPAIGGNGPLLDYAVRMRQFDTEAGFDRMLARGALTGKHMDQAAKTLAAFHQSAAVADAASGHGSPQAVTGPVLENFAQIGPHIEAQVSDRSVLAQFALLERWSRAACERHADTFRERLDGGFIRECHGDLHLRNIVYWQGKVVPFDCIEFDPELRWIDCINELAFLLMDLDENGRPDLSRRLLNAYLEDCGDYAGLELLRFYMVYRALVRVKVESLRLAQLDNEDPGIRKTLASYLLLAAGYTRQPPPRLIITHGLSGSGKTFVSQQLIEQRHIIRLRSDVERKRLFGLDPRQRSGHARDEGIYQPEATAHTYSHLLNLADQLLNRGFTVLVDAAFLKRAQRDMFASLARARKAPFLILHCESDPDLQRQRVAHREASGKDASEAGLAILDSQIQNQERLDDAELENTITVVTTGPPDLAEFRSWWAE